MSVSIKSPQLFDVPCSSWNLSSFKDPDGVKCILRSKSCGSNSTYRCDYEFIYKNLEIIPAAPAPIIATDLIGEDAMKSSRWG